MIKHETSFGDDDIRDKYSTPKDTKDKAKWSEIIKISCPFTNARKKHL